MHEVLIVDDDEHIRDVVRFALQKEGFVTREADDGTEALRCFQTQGADLVILDIKMPGMDGLDVCRSLRRETAVPILFLSSKDEEVDRIIGLEMGGDDYVTKPFSPRELVARVKAVLRRAPVVKGPSGKLLRHADICLDLEKRVLHVRQRAVELTRHEYKLLEALMRAPGKAFTRNELLDYLYPMGEALVIDRVVDVHIGKLRKKIESNPSDPSYILTVRGIGYRFAEEHPSSPVSSA